MASSLHVKLTEDDVPGAKLTHNNIADNSNLQLRRWLACRGLKSTGNKSELIERCKNCIQSGKQNDIDVSIDGGKWYQKLLSPGTSNAASTNILPIVGWKAFSPQSLPPLFNYGNVFHWIIESLPGLPDDEMDDEDDNPVSTAATEKPLKRGRTYVSSGHVGDVQVKSAGNKTHFKAGVLPSMRGGVYAVTTTLSSASGSVIDASCHCKASSLGRCSHVAALLLFLSDHVAGTGQKPACTDLPCQWNRGQKRKNPRNIRHAHYSSYKKELASVIKFDPRPPGTVTTQTDINRFLSDLTLGRKNSELSMWETVLCRTYEDYQLSNCREAVLRGQISVLYDNLRISTCISKMIDNTIDQSVSDRWHQQRYCRMTASTAKESVQLWNAFETCGQTDGIHHRVLNFLRKKLWGLDRVFTRDMSRGLAKEDVARTAYYQYKKTVNSDFSVEKSGLWVSGEHPELACSPDGLVHDPSESHSDGLLEIKVLKISQDNSFDEVRLMSSDRTKTDLLSRQCFNLKDGQELTLKRNHMYFYQIQFQLAVTGRCWCDFVLWSPKCAPNVERIRRDEGFIDIMLKANKNLWRSVVAVEVFEMRTPRGLRPFFISY